MCSPFRSLVQDDPEIHCGTLGFVLKDQHGGRYITAAAHGFDTTSALGDDTKDVRAYGKDCCSPGSDFGTVIIDDDSQDFAHPTDDHDPAFGSDVALIRIDKDKYGSVSPSLRYWTGPTGVAGIGDGQLDDLLYIHDFNHFDITTSPSTPAHDPSPRMARFEPRDSINNNNFFYDDGRQDGEPHEIPGASGAPFLLAASGKALGLNGNCHCGTATFGYPTLDYVLRRFSLPKFGYRHLRLELDTAPYHPPLPPERD